MKGRKFVVGDIHGAYKALQQCLDRAQFDYDHDLLISLGDLCDGWPETSRTIDELLKIKHLVLILGNHDLFLIEYLETGIAKDIWLDQGGRNTVRSYPDGIPEAHEKLLKSATSYHVEDNNLFVHAGYDPNKHIEDQSDETLVWDRNFVEQVVYSYQNGKTKPNFSISYDNVFLGHTPVQKFNSEEVINAYNVWLTDSGAGWNGYLTLINIETKELIKSDRVPTLYPESRGRYD